MLSQSHSVNTSIESCVTHFLRWKESQSQSEKNALCERAFSSPRHQGVTTHGLVTHSRVTLNFQMFRVALPLILGKYSSLRYNLTLIQPEKKIAAVEHYNLLL